MGVHAWGPDLAACLRQCTLGVFNLMVPLDTVAPAETREVAAAGDSADALVVNWLNECLFLHDVEGFVVHDVRGPAWVGDRRVHGLLVGEPVDPGRHPRGILVKAATYHGLRVDAGPDRASVRVILDV